MCNNNNFNHIKFNNMKIKLRQSTLGLITFFLPVLILILYSMFTGLECGFITVSEHCDPDNLPWQHLARVTTFICLGFGGWVGGSMWLLSKHDTNEDKQYEIKLFDNSNDEDWEEFQKWKKKHALNKNEITRK